VRTRRRAPHFTQNPRTRRIRGLSATGRWVEGFVVLALQIAEDRQRFLDQPERRQPRQKKPRSLGATGVSGQTIRKGE
jgi:hypothetical protein